MKTSYYTDNWTLYSKESFYKKAFKFINNLFENPKIANIAGFAGAVVPILLMIKWVLKKT